MVIVCFIYIIFVMNTSISLADSGINIIANKDVIHKNEITTVKIEIDDISIAAFTIEIYWDRTMLEYMKGPENSNDSEDRILYTWVSENGENKQNVIIEGFEFKGIQEGIANIVVTGEFYNANGEQVEIADSNLQIQVGEKQESLSMQSDETDNMQGNVPNNSSKLSVLRLNQEGISPEFNKDIKEYYLIVNETIKNLEITATPENKNAIVDIIGNKNLKLGRNEIQIKVQSEDKTETSLYKVYVTRTKDINLANANLETLAIRQATLDPEFNARVTHYSTEVANDIDQLDILAIPQNPNAEVNVQTQPKLDIGKNKIVVNVLSEDKITNKTYEVIVYRRNKEEEQKVQEEQKIEAEKLSAILKETNNEEENQNNIEKENSNTAIVEQKKNIIVQIIFFLLVIAIIIGSIFWTHYKSKKEM